MRLLQITFLTVAMMLSAADPLGLHAAMAKGGAVRVSADADSCWGTRTAPETHFRTSADPGSRR